MLLIERGRIQVNTTPKEWVEKALIRSPLYEAPLTHEIAVRSRIINLPHQDPADRFIAATALELNLTLITADDHLLKHSGVST
jgi:PIN domain nuclease of toxin-antitoxin system